MARIAIVANTNDVHARTIQNSIENRHNEKVEIITSAEIACSGELHWTPHTSGTVPGGDGSAVNLREVKVIWYRRKPQVQYLAKYVSDEHQAMIDIDSEASLSGTLLSTFMGTWVSHPNATLLADNKLTQLSTASSCGLRIPQTIVSQDPEKILDFCRKLNNQVIVKTVRGTRAMTAATTIKPELLQCKDTLALCPTIYQEKVEGTRHLRVTRFGETFKTALITTDDLDWRFNLNKPIEPFELDKETKRKILEFEKKLDLRMGIYDLKLDSNGEPVFLEINPQGQFLFVEGLCNLSITEAFSDYLVLDLVKDKQVSLRAS